MTLVGVSLGANSSHRFHDGQEDLSNREAYCRFLLQPQNASASMPRYHSTIINSILYPGITEELFDHIWNQPQRLAAYRDRRVHFTHLPEFLNRFLSESEGALQSKLRQLTHSTALLKSQRLKLFRSPASKIQTWKTENEIPNQIEHIRRDEIRLRLQLDSLQKRHFSELELFQLYIEARTRSTDRASLPVLATAVDFERSLLGDKIFLRPVWLYTTSDKQEWIVKLASQEPLLTLSGSMVTDDIRQAFKNKRLPSSFDTYSELVHFPLNTGEQNIQPTQFQLKSTRFKFVTNNRLVISGASAFNRWNEINTDSHDFSATSTTHLAVQASLDLGCLKQGHWLEKIEHVYEPLLEVADDEKVHTFQHIDPRSLKAFNLLKSL